MKIIALFLGIASVALGREEIFETATYRIVIEVRCPESYVACDNVRYVGTSRKTGKWITLSGKTLHSYASDGVTPTQFQGYYFLNGTVAYFVSEHGYLEVTKGDKVLVHEEGHWDWEQK
jgi:hypothetical protein